MQKINTIIVSAFPGTGKSYFKRNSEIKVLDSDSRRFSWTKGVRNPKFPQNYVEHIKKQMGKVDIIMVSTHKDVRDLLIQNDLSFNLIYPNLELKDEYLARYKKRRNKKTFIDMMEENWEKFINQLIAQEGCQHIVLDSGEYVYDVLWGATA